MNPYQTKVHEFHKATASTIGKTLAMRDPELRAKLIMEEAVETVAAMGFTARGSIHAGWGEHNDVVIADFAKTYQTPNTLDTIDGICDLLYVLFGAAVTMGFDVDPFFAEVHRANMTKLTGPKRADGKQLKPEGWKPPDHKGIIERLGI